MTMMSTGILRPGLRVLGASEKFRDAGRAALRTKKKSVPRCDCILPFPIAFGAQVPLHAGPPILNFDSLAAVVG